eukprot:TRINITY_DN10361_c0_g1_i2.p1 TRINITY_DN10361_c0_g1~~TRINITY_DN10361_c0_g1_i2.p1  ORF type:complete len:825 (+),score=165.58 TRINITY_DN10361_c0_g1_i2:367-2475(+)
MAAPFSPCFMPAAEVIAELFSTPYGLESSSRLMYTKLCFDQVDYFDAVRTIMGKVALLQPVFLQHRTVSQEASLNLCKTIGRLACVIGEGFSSPIVQCTPEGLSLADLLVEVTGHPDPAISSLPMDCWCIFADHWCQSEIIPPPVTQMYARVVQNLLAHCATRAYVSDELDEYRVDAVDPILSALYILGARTLTKYLRDVLTSAMQTGQHAQVDAVMFVTIAVGEKLHYEEAGEVVEILRLIVGAPLHPTLSRGTVLLLESYSDLLERDPPLLVAAMRRMIAYMKAQEFTCIAGKAFTRFCMAVNGNGDRSMLQSALHNVAEGLVAEGQAAARVMGAEDRAQVIGGLTVLVGSFKDPAQAKAGISRILSPLLEGVSRVGSSPVTQDTKRALQSELKAIGAVFSNSPQGAGMDLLNQAWALLDSLARSDYMREATVVASLCQLFSTVIKALGAAESAQVAPALASLMCSLYERTLSARCIDTLVTTLEIVTTLPTLYTSGFQHICACTFPVLLRDGPAAHLDMVEEVFTLASLMFSKAPQDFLSIPQQCLDPTVQLACTCVVLQERDPAMQACSFMQNLIKAAPSNNKAHSYVNMFGHQICTNFMNALANGVDDRLASAQVPTLQSLMSSPVLPTHTVQQWVGDMLKTETFAPALSGPDRTRLFSAMFRHAGNKQRFKALMKDFMNICIGRQTTDALVSYEMY